MRQKGLIILFFCILSSCIFAYGKPPDSTKIKFDLNLFNDSGYVVKPTKWLDGYINYDFCIPQDEKLKEEVLKVDTTLQIESIRPSKHTACSDSEWYCIGSSHQRGFKEVLLKLTSLGYIKKISAVYRD